MDYSSRDFTGQSLIDASDMDGLTITGSCFAQQYPDTMVFPLRIVGVTFINCNLDNCHVPDGNIVKGGSQRRILALDCLVDENNKFVSVL